MRTFSKLWKDQNASVISTELILIATIAVIGLIVGLATFRNSLVQELGDSAVAISVLNQSYLYETDLDPGAGGVQNTVTVGFAFFDVPLQSEDEARVEVTVTVFDSMYTDMNDFCDHNIPGLEGSDPLDPACDAPACMNMDTPPVDEGTTLTVTP